MDEVATIQALAALAQSTRLDAFRALVAHEPDGLAAGEVARLIGVPHNTMSSHLAILQRAGLIGSERRSRSIIFRVDFGAMREMLAFVLKDCCSHRPELCEPLIADLMPYCQQRNLCR